MSSYTVIRDFMAFQRDYKRGQTLTADDLSCWEPEEDRIDVVKGLISQGKIEAADVADPAAKYPATWGGSAATTKD